MRRCESPKISVAPSTCTRAPSCRRWRSSPIYTRGPFDHDLLGSVPPRSPLPHPATACAPQRTVRPAAECHAEDALGLDGASRAIHCLLLQVFQVRVRPALQGLSASSQSGVCMGNDGCLHGKRLFSIWQRSTMHCPACLPCMLALHAQQYRCMEG